MAGGQVLIARAPLRIGLAGGGTDLPAYYERYGGLVVSTTIDKYVHVHISPHGSDAVHIASADYRTFYRHHLNTPMRWDGHLALPRAVLHELGVQQGLSVFVASEVPPGTGLGSSSAVAVALVQAIGAYLERSLSRQALAELACRIELEKLHAPIGKQDQFAAAFGGLNAISFHADRVDVEPLHIDDQVVRQLASRLLLFFTGDARDSATILSEQQAASARGEAQVVEGLHRIKQAAEDCRAYLEAGDLDAIGRLLDESWRQKRQLASGITTRHIDELYDAALMNGAIGGKITGAGGGGFLLLYCREAEQEGLTHAMEERGLRRMDFQFEDKGVQIGSIHWNELLNAR
jgi:D-glycero-alpha-D-manno-heptose-7-phosphate kinase